MNKELVKKSAERLKAIRLEKELRIMEICGTHTAAFFKTGVKDFFPDGLTLIDGPGCPVCVTSNEYLDRAIEMGKLGAMLATFGDMIKVPSSYGSLGEALSNGADIRVVYSPLEAVEIAALEPDKETVFLSVGFETTAPAEAAAVLKARERGLNNFSLLPGNKLTPPAVSALLDANEVHIDGFIIPGHVSVLTGLHSWDFIAKKYGRPGVVTGFEAGDLLMGVLSLLELLLSGKNEIKNCYEAFVREEGNEKAMEIMYSVFEPCDAVWRGLGLIPQSGLGMREAFADFDASVKLPVEPLPVKEHTGCRCGELLRGLITPPECPLFSGVCSPERPIGPCMVSSEGPCSAYYKYWRK